MNSHGQSDATTGYATDIFHLEKYIVPGTFAVAQLFLLPWYLLGGRPLGTWDLGTVVLLALVAGHLIESLKVYQWGPKVRQNYTQFKGRIEGILGTWEWKSDMPEVAENALTVLFVVMPPTARSEFSWNLVRWQKMTVMSVTLVAGGVEWFLFAILKWLSSCGLNPFNSTFTIAAFKKDIPWHWSALTELILGGLFLVIADRVYKYGLNRQVRNNESYFHLIRRHKEHILAALQEGETKTPS